jgi:hypothetical protein
MANRPRVQGILIKGLVYLDLASMREVVLNRAIETGSEGILIDDLVLWLDQLELNCRHHERDRLAKKGTASNGQA